MKQVEFYIVFDADGYVVGDMDQEAALERWNDEIGNAEFSVREIVVNVPEAKTIEVTMPTSGFVRGSMPVQNGGQLQC
jgi:hypothetical protein